jgi:hypothetical protein
MHFTSGDTYQRSVPHASNRNPIGLREWDEVFSILRSDYQREQVQLMRAEIALCSILLSLSRTEHSLGEHADADVSRAKARIAHDSAKSYLRDLRLDEAQSLFAQESLEQLAESFDRDLILTP